MLSKEATIAITPAERRTLERAHAILESLKDRVDAIAGGDDHPARDDAAIAWSRIDAILHDERIEVWT